MAWIKTVSFDNSDEKLLRLMQEQRSLYPPEYSRPVEVVDGTPDKPKEGIVSSHSLIPEALYHAFSTFGVLMSADLPLNRSQHEMIATMVSVTNKCHY